MTKEEKRLYDIEYRKINKQRRKEQHKEWSLKNKEHLYEYHLKNKQHRKEYNRQYQKFNKEKVNSINRKHAKNNRAKFNARAAKYRANKLQQTPKWVDLKAITEFYKNCPEGYHVDHIIPINGDNVRGLHTLENLQYLPAIENLRKGKKV